jgi:hypothetical protein
VQQLRTGYVFGTNLGGSEAKAIRAVPEYRTLPGALVDQDVGCLVGTLLAQNQATDIYACFLKALALNIPAKVIADRAYVLGPEAELGAGDDGTSDLAARAEQLLLIRNFARIGGEFWKK